MSRKIQEAILSVWLERNIPRIRLSSSISIAFILVLAHTGIEAAAQRYYGKSARQLTLQNLPYWRAL